VPHDIVEPKTRSKKKLVMQLDQDVKVCGIFLCFISTPCFEILLLLLFSFGGGHALFLFFFFYAL
jgi:hypothetical protein